MSYDVADKAWSYRTCDAHAGLPHRDEGTTRFPLPVSNTTLKHWAGMPMHSSPKYSVGNRALACASPRPDIAFDSDVISRSCRLPTREAERPVVVPLHPVHVPFGPSLSFSPTGWTTAAAGPSDLGAGGDGGFFGLLCSLMEYAASEPMQDREDGCSLPSHIGFGCRAGLWEVLVWTLTCCGEPRWMDDSRMDLPAGRPLKTFRGLVERRCSDVDCRAAFVGSR
mmetsp:Transcript_45025/g.111821  ORF Transcript_45025/g.111821 Transcript_45025/m.111821 type:complete len:224 (-) Transcript_45025:72-743(-)